MITVHTMSPASTVAADAKEGYAQAHHKMTNQIANANRRRAIIVSDYYNATAAAVA